jgi:hypothetical protein
MRWIGAALVLSAGLLMGASGAVAEPANEPGAATTLAPSAPAEEAKVDGFRSANFGMTEAQVRQAIRKDFPTLGDKLASEANPSEKTTVLTLHVTDLIPGTGKAKLSYIFGYNTKKLIQVNVNWIAEPKSPASAEGLVGAANLLRNYFMAGGFQPDSIIANRQMPNGYVVFRGTDMRSHMVMLVLSGTTATPESEREKAGPIAMQLSYILDPEHPDVYQVPKGQF